MEQRRNGPRMQTREQNKVLRWGNVFLSVCLLNSIHQRIGRVHGGRSLLRER